MSSPDFCTKCGRELDPDDAFCGGCGAPRRGGAPAADSPVATAEVAPREVPPNTQAKLVRRTIFIVTLVIPIGIMLFTLHDCGSAEGQLTVTGGEHGDFTFVTTGCASMQPYGRMGANLHGDGPNDGAVYVSLDPVEGHHVQLEVPGSCQNADGTECTVFDVPRAQCETFDVSIDYSGVTVNDVRLTEGHVRLNCTLADGADVVGSFEFDGC